MNKIFILFLTISFTSIKGFAVENSLQEDGDLKLKKEFYQNQVKKTQEKITLLSEKLKNYEECAQDPKKEFQLKNGALLLRSERHLKIVKDNIIYGLTKQKHQRTKSTDVSIPILPQLSKTLFLETLWKSFNKITGNLLPYAMTKKREIIQNSFIQSLSQIYDALYIDNHPNIGRTFEDSFHGECALRPNLFYTYGATSKEAIFYERKETPGTNNNCLLYCIFSNNLFLLEKLRDTYQETFLKDQKIEVIAPTETEKPLESSKEETQNEKIVQQDEEPQRKEASEHEVNLQNLNKIIELSKLYGLEHPQLWDLSALRISIFKLVQHHALKKTTPYGSDLPLYLYETFDLAPPLKESFEAFFENLYQTSSAESPEKETFEIFFKNLKKSAEIKINLPEKILEEFFNYLIKDVKNQLNAQVASALSIILEYPINIFSVELTRQNPKKLYSGYKYLNFEKEPISILQEGNGQGGHFSRLERVEKKDRETESK